MVHNALFIGFGFPVRGREQQATQVFGEWVELLGGAQNKGNIKSFTPVFLDPHGGDLNGFFLVTGDANKLNDWLETEELRRAITRAQLIAENVGIVRGMTGDEIGKQMAVFQHASGELAK